MNKATVLCVGVLVADVFIPPLPQLPAAGELVATEDFLVEPGGCAANVAVALTKLGVETAICGRVGDDLFGRFVESELRNRGIETTGVLRTPGRGTSKTVIVPVAGEDRRYIHTFGANAILSAEDIDLASLAAARAIYIGGYLILPGLREAELADRLSEVRRHGGTVVLDVAAPAGKELSLDAVSRLLPLADYFVPNTDEARALTGESVPQRQAERLVERGARQVIIKLGDHGAFVHSATGSFEIAAPPVDVVESSGAGDGFAAGLIVGILEGWDLEATVRFASVVGGSACTALGCSAGIYTRSEAEHFIASHALPTRRVALV